MHLVNSPSTPCRSSRARRSSACCALCEGATEWQTYRSCRHLPSTEWRSHQQASVRAQAWDLRLAWAQDRMVWAMETLSTHSRSQRSNPQIESIENCTDTAVTGHPGYRTCRCNFRRPGRAWDWETLSTHSRSHRSNPRIGSIENCTDTAVSGQLGYRPCRCNCR